MITHLQDAQERHGVPLELIKKSLQLKEMEWSNKRLIEGEIEWSNKMIWNLNMKKKRWKDWEAYEIGWQKWWGIEKIAS